MVSNCIMIIKQIKSIFRTTKLCLNKIFWAFKTPITPSLTIFNFSIQYEMSFNKDNKQYSVRLKKIKTFRILFDSSAGFIFDSKLWNSNRNALHIHLGIFWLGQGLMGFILKKCVCVIFLGRDALTKMKEVYVKNPQMGDPNSVDPRLGEIANNIEKLQAEAQKFEVRVNEHLEIYIAQAWMSRSVQCKWVCVL